MERPVGAIIVAVALAAVTPATAQDGYPNRPLRLIVGWPPGGGADLVTRMLTPKLASALGQTVVIDNRPGASGNIGAELAAKSPPDGYTIVWTVLGTSAINPHIYAKPGFNGNDLAPIVWLSAVSQILVVHPSLPVTSVGELIALAKAKPDQLSYGSAGSGAINHLAAELFNMRAGTRIVHVPYKGGGPLSIALLSGEVGLNFAEPGAVVQQIQSGKLRAIAVTSAKRSLGFPDLPTIAESGVPGFDVTSWNGMLAPARTPKQVIARLNAEYNRILTAADTRRWMIANGYDPVGGPPEKFGAHIRSELAKWGPVVKSAGLGVD